MISEEYSEAIVDGAIVDDMAVDWSNITTYTYPLGDTGVKIKIYNTSGVKLWECSDEIGKNILHSLTFVLSENGCAGFSFTLNEKPPILIQYNYRVDFHLFRDNDPWYSGYIINKPEFTSTNDTFSYSGFGFFEQLENCKVDQAYNSTTFPTQADREISEVVKHLITNFVEGKSNIVYNASKIEATSPAFYITDMDFDKVSAKEAIKQLAEMAQNYVYGVDADREFFFQPKDTDLNVNAVKFVGKHLEVFIPETDITDVKNDIDVFGGRIDSNSNFMLNVNDSDSIVAYGRRWGRLTIPPALDSNDAQRWANYKLSELKDPTEKAKVKGIDLDGEKIEATGKARIMPNKKTEVEHEINHDTYAELNAGTKDTVEISESPLEVKLENTDTADWSTEEESFDDLTGWTDADGGGGVSEIDPAGQLHQDSNGSSGYGLIYKDVGSLDGDFTAEFRIKFNIAPGTQSHIVRFGTDDNDIQFAFSSNAMKVYDGSTYQTCISKAWETGVWYKIRVVVHNGHTDVDTYLDDSQTPETTDVDCSAGSIAADNGVVTIGTNPNANEDSEWHMDYLKIDAGQHTPGTYEASGTLISEWIDLSDQVYKLGLLEWSESLPTDTDIEFQTRTNDEASSDGAEEWRPASSKLTTPSGSQIESSVQRYIQYKAILTSSDNTVTPKLYLSDSKVVKINYSKEEIKEYELPIKKVTYKVNAAGIKADAELGAVFLPVEKPILELLRNLKLQEALQQANVKQLS
jgi:hypothetical protein